MLEELREQVYKANMQLVEYKLISFTWGNVSGFDREKGLVVIKPSGVEYSSLTPEKLVVLDLDGNIVEGNLRPSSDTPTHLELYRKFPECGGVTHTHSTWATIFAQAGRDVNAYGTTHADYFSGGIPCTRQMTPAEIGGEYELNTGKVIVETFEKRNIDPAAIRAALVYSHGPFTWGKNALESVEVAAVLEQVAMMAFNTELIRGAAGENGRQIMQDELLHKHFDRKHGKNKYYGQN